MCLLRYLTWGAPNQNFLVPRPPCENDMRHEDQPTSKQRCLLGFSDLEISHRIRRSSQVRSWLVVFFFSCERRYEIYEDRGANLNNRSIMQVPNPHSPVHQKMVSSSGSAAHFVQEQKSKDSIHLNSLARIVGCLQAI